MELITSIFTYFFFVNSVHCAYTSTMEKEIRDETVFNTSYDAMSRPTEVTQVYIGINVLAIDELDLKEQTLTVAGWITLQWIDTRLTWDYASKNDLKHIYTEPAYIWKPELLVDNSLSKIEVIEDVHLKLKIKYNGLVQWEPPRLFTTHCEVDITYYPYDRQHCSINIVSWGYTVDEVSLKHLYEDVNMEDFVARGAWEVEHTAVEDQNLTEHQADGTVIIYPQLDFWIYLKRRTAFYNLNVMMPMILTSLMVGLVFIVPLQSGEKVSYLLTVFLALAVLMTIVSDTLPPTSIHTSILGIYLAVVLISSAFGILLTVLILNLFHKTGHPQDSSHIVTLTRCVAKFICWHIPVSTNETNSVTKVSPMALQDIDNDVTADEEVMANNDETNDITWSRIAQIMDRFCFLVFFTANVVMNVTFVIVLSTGEGSFQISH